MVLKIFSDFIIFLITREQLTQEDHNKQYRQSKDSQEYLEKIPEGNVQPLSFALGDSQIEIVEKTKYLGSQLDQYLVQDENTRFLHAKVSRALGVLKYAKKILLQEILSQLYR